MTAFRHLQLEKGEHDILWLTLNVRGATTNLLTPEVLDELATACAECRSLGPRGLVFRSGKTTGFIAGVDIKLIVNIKSREQAQVFLRQGQQVCQQFADLPFPTLAMIDGVCVGGGMELALALDYRIASNSPDTRLGLPEIKLGIHPGFGGTVRAVRKLGPANAMELMLSGKLLQSDAALQMKLIDRSVPPQELTGTAVKTILEQPRKAKPSLSAASLNKLATSRKLLGNKLRQQMAERFPPQHYPAPDALITSWEKYGNNPDAMYEAEVTSVSRLVTEKTAQNLTRVFLLQQRLKAQADKQLFHPGHIHIISDTETGHNIASWCKAQGIHTTIQNTVTPDRETVCRADVILEACSEELASKQKCIAELEKLVRSDAILATFSHSSPLEDLSGKMQNPGRLIGLHFFTPVSEMPLVEVIHDAFETDENIIRRTCSFIRHLNKLPLPVKSSPGFLVNRILMPYLFAGIRLQQQGVPVAIIDAAARDFGMSLGPLEMADKLGLDTCKQIGETLFKKLGAAELPLTVYHMIKAGNLGRKTGRGFHHYRNGKIMQEEKHEWQGNTAMLQSKLIDPMIEEACLCLEQGIVEDADLLDAGMIFGGGFPPFRGSLLQTDAEKSNV